MFAMMAVARMRVLRTQLQQVADGPTGMEADHGAS